ncbi:MAG: hypothetical protein RLZZ435_2095 [Cyanobacteriota bacterium]|jgi:hypothetical protein
MDATFSPPAQGLRLRNGLSIESEKTEWKSAARSAALFRLKWVAQE